MLPLALSLLLLPSSAGPPTESAPTIRPIQSPRMHAIRLAALYRQGDAEAFEARYDEAIRRGVSPVAMMRTSRAYRAVLREVGADLRAERTGVLPRRLGLRLVLDVVEGRWVSG